MKNLVQILVLLGIDKKYINNIIQQKKLPQNENDIYEIFKYHLNKSDVGLDYIKRNVNKCFELNNQYNKLNIKTVDILDKDYPDRLREIDNPPLVLYCKGNVDILFNENTVNIVGSRNAELKYLELSYKFSEYFLNNNFVVVSGLASGCDTYAHKACVDNNKQTIAVLGTKINDIYPKENIRLSEKILENDGCIISENGIYDNVSKFDFVKRNRIQSGLSDGVLVARTTLNSGTIHQIKYGISQNKIVGCINTNENNIVIEKYKEIVRVNANNIEQFKNGLLDYKKNKLIQDKTIQLQFNV